MPRLVAYRTYQPIFRFSISRISDTFLIYQAERKRGRSCAALDLKASKAGGHFLALGRR